MVSDTNQLDELTNYLTFKFLSATVWRYKNRNKNGGKDGKHKELDICESEAQRMTTLLREGIVPKANNDSVLFKCNSCDFEEVIPIEAVYFFDIFDPNDIDSPPCVGCKVCTGTMIPKKFSS